MNRILLFLLLFSVTLSLRSQNISVASFKSLPNDLDARVNFPKKDQNGDVCAIIKVVTTQTGFSFDGDQLGITANEKKTGEYWLYVPYGSKRLTVKHDQLGVMRDYRYEEPIQKATVYEMVLVSGKVSTTVIPVNPVWLTIRSNPEGAEVYINEVLKGVTPLPIKLLPGKYTYRIEKPTYHNAVGTTEITGMEKDGKKDLPVTLKPAFGTIKISTLPEQGAKVLIDDEETGKTTPFSLTKIKSGTHKITVKKDLFQPKSIEVIVKDGELTEKTISLTSNGVYVTINAQNDADIYIDSKLTGRGTYQGQIPAGVTTFEAKKPGYYDDKKDKELVAGETVVVNLTPQPIVGSLEIISDPMDATVFLNDEQKGTTPITLQNLMVGNYVIRLEKEGYYGILNDISILENKTTEVSKKLISSQVKTNPPVATETEKQEVKQEPIQTAEKTADKTVDKPIIKPNDQFVDQTDTKQMYNANYYKYKHSKNFWLMSAFVNGGIVVYTAIQSEEYLGQYKTTATTDAEELRKKWQLYNKIAYIATSMVGICTIEYIIKAGKQSKAKRQTIGFYPQPLDHGAGLNLVYKF